MSDSDVVISLPTEYIDDTDGSDKKRDGGNAITKKKYPASYYFPSRGNVDSWATRIGALAVVQGLFIIMDDTALAFTFGGASVLFILSLFPLWSAADEVIKADTSTTFSIYPVASFMMLLLMLFVSILLLFPSFGLYFNAAIGDYPYISFIVFMVIFGILYVINYIKHLDSGKNGVSDIDGRGDV